MTKLKIKKASVIASLEDALKVRENAPDTYQKEFARYEREHKAWETKVKKQLKPSAITEVRLNDWSNEPRLIVEYKGLKVDDEPQAPSNPNKWTLENEIKEIKQSIKMLEMCEDDEISVSLYKSVSQYL